MELYKVATIHDVAKIAGVNSSTVSRVINGKIKVLEETREKIYAAMKQLDYHPNSAARSLANGRSNAIGIAVDVSDEDAFSNIFFNNSLFAIERIAQEKGYNLILTNVAMQTGNSIEKLILEQKVDGLIIPPSVIDPSLINIIDEFPCVVLGQPKKNYSSLNWVDIDNVQGSKIAVKHLYKQGYSRIAYMCSKKYTSFSKHRVKGYKQALENLQPHVYTTDGTLAHTKQQAESVLLSKDHPDAFICNDNITAFGVLKALKEAGLNCPNDVGIVAFDNYPLSEFTEPQLTSIDIDTSILGQQAAELLFKHIEYQNPNQHIILESTLIERESSKRQ